MEIKKTSRGARVLYVTPHLTTEDGWRILVRGPGPGRGGMRRERVTEGGWAVALCRGREEEERLRLWGV